MEIRTALEELLSDPQRVRDWLMPQGCSPAHLKRARERNVMGKPCADGVAVLRVLERIVASDLFALGISLHARLSAVGTGAERDLATEISLAPTAAGASAGASLRASFEALSLRDDMRWLFTVLGRHRAVAESSLVHGVDSERPPGSPASRPEGRPPWPTPS